MAAAVAKDEALLGHPVQIVQRFISWLWQPATQSGVIDQLRAVSTPSRTVMITWEPGDYGATSAHIALSSIASGAEDPEIRTFLGQLTNFPGPVALRFAHEMNGSWYPWAGDPATYVAAWRHIHALVASIAPSVKMVWAVNNVDQPASNTMEAYWPGDSQVEVIGIDGYNCLRGWQTPGAVFSSAYSRVQAIDRKLPVWITETASCESSAKVAGSAGHTKAAWITALYQYRDSAMPAVAAIVWFDRNKEFDWQIASSASAAVALRASVG